MGKSCVLTAGYSPADCSDLGIGGVTGSAWFIDYYAWKAATITAGADNDIAAITLTRTGDAAFKFDFTLGAAVLSSPSTVNAGGKSGFAHTAQIFMATKDPAKRAMFEKYINYGKGVWIFEQDDIKSPFEIYGNDVGMKLTVMDALPNDASTGGGFTMQWVTPSDTTLENRAPITFRDPTNDRTTTTALLTALETPVA